MRRQRARAALLAAAVAAALVSSPSAQSLFSLEGLAGEWTRVGSTRQVQSFLTIHTVSADGFGFQLGAMAGNSNGQIDGVATRRGGTAAYRDEDTQCLVTFTRRGDGLLLTTSPECTRMGGVGVVFDGEYRKGISIPSPKPLTSGVDPATLCAAAKKGAGLPEESVPWEETNIVTGEFRCATGDGLLSFSLDGDEDAVHRIVVNAYTDQKLLQRGVAQRVVPLVRALFEAEGFEAPADFVKAIESLRPGRFKTALGTATTEFAGKLSGGTARYDIQIVTLE